MTKYNVKTSGLCCSGIALILLILPVLAAAGHEEVINMDWVVTDSRQGLTTQSCNNPTCLKVGDQFEVQFNNSSSKNHGAGWLVIDRNKSRLAAFEALIRLHKTANGELIRVDVYFLDYLASNNPSTVVPLKRMRITPVAEANQDLCKKKFKDLDRGNHSNYDYSEACPLDATIVAHWSVCSLDSLHNCDNYVASATSGPWRTRGVPDDGQGAGGPPE